MIKFVGAAYLVYLGVQTIRHRGDLTAVLGAASGPADRRLYWQGVLVGFTNPKVLVFFAAVLPQFVDARAGSATTQMLVLGLLFGNRSSPWQPRCCPRCRLSRRPVSASPAPMTIIIAPPSPPTRRRRAGEVTNQERAVPAARPQTLSSTDAIREIVRRYRRRNNVMHARAPKAHGARR